MASIDSQSKTVEQVEKVQLKYMVDKENNRVLWVEAEKDFVDVLFSFLTLPLGTIARLVSQKSNSEPVRIGSLSSLYQSVADLKEERFWTKECKEMLLRPRNSTEVYCNNLKLNTDDTPMEYFCDSKNRCHCASTFRNKKCCHCFIMDTKVSISLRNGFVMETASFIIFDDLHVIPYAFGTTLHLLQKFGVQNSDTIEELMVDISKKEVIDFLKLSLLSKTPLTYLILRKKQSHHYSKPRNQSEFVVRNAPSPCNEGRKMSLKITIRKSTGEILFAEGEEAFADFVLSFLTMPLGGVLNMLEVSSSLFCLDNLYKSLTVLSPQRLLLSNDIKDKLVKPKCFPTFELKSQILPIGVESSLNVFGKNWSFVDPKLSISKSSQFGEFVKGPSLYMVTDDLVVTPMTSTSALSLLSKSKVPILDLEERVIQIGVNEGLSILKASLVSTSALTNALKPLISKVKEEK